MSSVKIISDSTCDLSEELLKRYDIDIVPLHILLGDDEYEDGIGLKPEEGTSVNVCVETDRKNTFREKIVSSEKAKIPNQPFMVKTKIKAKKFVYYRLVLECDELQPAVTVTAADFRVRMTGYTK